MASFIYSLGSLFRIKSNIPTAAQKAVVQERPPAPVKQIIGSYLDLKSITCCRTLNREWHTALNQELFWNQLTQRDFNVTFALNQDLIPSREYRIRAVAQSNLRQGFFEIAEVPNCSRFQLAAQNRVFLKYGKHSFGIGTHTNGVWNKKSIVIKGKTFLGADAAGKVYQLQKVVPDSDTRCITVWEYNAKGEGHCIATLMEVAQLYFTNKTAFFYSSENRIVIVAQDSEHNYQAKAVVWERKKDKTWANISEQGIDEEGLKVWQIIENGNGLLCSKTDRDEKNPTIVIYTYDPQTNKWTKIHTIAHNQHYLKRFTYVTLSPENTLFIAGMENSSADPSAAVQIWDYRTLKCISVFSPMPIKCDSISANQTYSPSVNCVLPLSKTSILLGCSNGLQVFVKTEQSWYDSLWSYPWKHSFSFMQNNERSLQCGMAPDGKLFILQKDPSHRRKMRILDAAHFPREAPLWKTAQQFHVSQNFHDAAAQGALTRFNNLSTQAQDRVYGELYRMKSKVYQPYFGRQLFHYEAVETEGSGVSTKVPISYMERGQAIYNCLPIMKYTLSDIAYGFKRHVNIESSTPAFLIMQFNQLPAATKGMIYGEMYTLLKSKLPQDQIMNPRAGEFAFLNQNGFTATNRERAQAIENYRAKQKPGVAPAASTATAAAGTAPSTSGSASKKDN